MEASDDEKGDGEDAEDNLISDLVSGANEALDALAASSDDEAAEEANGKATKATKAAAKGSKKRKGPAVAESPAKSSPRTKRGRK
jgi:hypothetical protein